MPKSGVFLLFLRGIQSSLKGLRITFRHLRKSGHSRKIQDIRNDGYFLEKSGITTLNYPYQSIPVPDNGRYQLFNEIEDCIVCDKCAKVCPVDCIEIEPIKSTSEFGKTSDGTSKRIYAAKFDIDMAKCCFCGLCTTVCPTECLTMTDEYDFSVFDLGKMNFGFGNLTEEEAEFKRNEWEEHQKNKISRPVISKIEETASETEVPKAGFQPRLRPVLKSKSTESEHLKLQEENLLKEKEIKQEMEGEKVEIKPEPKRMRPVIGTTKPPENE